MALGAFLAGMVVGQSDFSSRAAADALPMRDAFAVMFFLSVGMLFDPQAALRSPGLILLALAIVVVGKPLSALALMVMMGYSSRCALGVAIALAQIGEFSFLLANVGKQVGVLPDAAMNALVAVAIVSIMLNPLLYRAVPRIEKWAASRPSLWKVLNPPLTDAHTRAQVEYSSHRGSRAVVIGYGPTGRTVTRLLKDNGIEPSIIEMNIETVRELRDLGFPAVYGDGSQRDTLIAAGLGEADTLILSTAGLASAAEVTRIARELNPQIQILARVAYLRDLPEMLKAGADRVYTGEGEVALALTESILHRLGATPEQIDRERDRAHRDLFGKPTAESSRARV